LLTSTSSASFDLLRPLDVAAL